MSEVEDNFVAWLRGQKMHDSASLVERLRAERDALRAALEYASDKLTMAGISRRSDYDVGVYTHSMVQDALARIDAALGGDGHGK